VGGEAADEAENTGKEWGRNHPLPFLSAGPTWEVPEMLQFEVYFEILIIEMRWLL
jgi:hypothetical protein